MAAPSLIARCLAGSARRAGADRRRRPDHCCQCGRPIALLGDSIVGRDIRIAMRHPQALQGSARRQARRCRDHRPRQRRASLAAVGPPVRWRHACWSGWPIARPRSPPNGCGSISSPMQATNCALRWRPFPALPRRSPRTVRSTRQRAAGFGATIHNEAARMLRIIEDLMGLSRIEADRFVAPRDVIDLARSPRSPPSRPRRWPSARAARSRSRRETRRSR